MRCCHFEYESCCFFLFAVDCEERTCWVWPFETLKAVVSLTTSSVCDLYRSALNLICLLWFVSCVRIFSGVIVVPVILVFFSVHFKDFSTMLAKCWDWKFIIDLRNYSWLIEGSRTTACGKTSLPTVQGHKWKVAGYLFTCKQRFCLHSVLLVKMHCVFLKFNKCGQCISFLT